MEINYKEIGKRLMEIRKSLGLNQKDAGKLIDSKVSYISEIERGKKPSIEYIYALATTANASFDWIFTGKEITSNDDSLNELLNIYSSIPSEARSLLLGTIKTIIQNSENPKDTISSTLKNGNDGIKNNIA